MKKLSWMFLCAMVVLLAGCGSSATNIPVGSEQKSESTPAQKETQKKSTFSLNEKASPVDGISIIITNFSIQAPKGDRTKDNYADANGEYFSHGSDIVKASDYNEIAIEVEIENNTDKAIGTAVAGWEAALQDGYKLKGLAPRDYFNLLGVEQVASHNKYKVTLYCTLEKSIDIKEINLIYNYLDYNDEWKKAIGDAISGKLTAEDYEKKFKRIPITWKLSK